jgi:hypothetical protein
MSNVKIVSTESDLFVEFAGIRIAKRGRPGTAHAGTWISLEPGFVVHLNASQRDHGGARRRGNARASRGKLGQRDRSTALFCLTAGS